MNKLIYLATPYSSKNPNKVQAGFEQEARFHEAARIAAALMKKGHHIFSPIAHCHPMAVRFDMPKDWDYWQDYAKVMLSRCDELWVAVMDYWHESTGVKAEIDAANLMGVRLSYVHPRSLRVIPGFPTFTAEDDL